MKGSDNLKTALMIIEIIISITVIVSVIIQPGRDAGFSGSISGISSQITDTRKKGKEGFLRKITEISAVAFLILAMVLSVM